MTKEETAKLTSLEKKSDHANRMLILFLEKNGNIIVRYKDSNAEKNFFNNNKTVITRWDKLMKEKELHDFRLSEYKIKLSKIRRKK